MSAPLISILINNYNYARFLNAAIDSALNQDYSTAEVVVVDDGSTDNSRDVILSYGDRIRPIFKVNGGQASAFNAGIAASRGELLCFLDSDDVFRVSKVSRVAETFIRHGLNSKPMMVHHLATVMNEVGDDVDGVVGKVHASPKNLYQFAKRHRFVEFEAGPTSTIAINRKLACRLFPIPEPGFRILADNFIVFGAFLVAEVYSMTDRLVGYRIHGKNNWNNWANTEYKKPPEFLSIVENYLNAKLVENGLAPVIDFDDSIYAWRGLVTERRWFKLAAHMLKVSIRDHDRYTAYFIRHTLMTVGARVRRDLKAWLDKAETQ